MAEKPLLFTGNANRPLADAVAKILKSPIEPSNVTRFNDGETRVQIQKFCHNSRYSSEMSGP